MLSKSSTGEGTILAELTAKLPVLLPSLQISDERSQARLPSGRVADLLVRAQFKSYRTYIAFEVKSNGEPRIARAAASVLRELVGDTSGVYPVFVAPVISEISRTICRRAGVGYLDLVGNAYLEFGPVLIDRTVPVPRNAPRGGSLGVFTPKGTRITRYLLANHKATVSITQLAGACKLSPAGAFRIVEGLELGGYVERDSWRRVKVADPSRLLTDWAKAWDVNRSTKSLYFSFEKAPSAILKNISHASHEFGLRYATTLMAGASLVDPFVRYDDVWVYTDSRRDDWVEALDLRSTESGANLVLLTPYDEGVFYGVENRQGILVVSLPQLYVDLYNFPARGREQADHLRESVIRY